MAPQATDPNATDPPIRVRLMQPALAKYRLAVFAELASRPGIDLHVAYTDDTSVPVVEPEGFDARFHRSRRGAGLTFSGFQWSLASRRRADVVLLPWATRELTLVPTLLRARAAGIGVVLWGHGFSKRESAVRRRLRNTIAGLADAMLLYNRTAADRLIGDGFDPERVFIAPNALDQTPIQEARAAWLDDPGAIDAFRRQHDLGDGPLLLFVSRLGADRRADLLLQAAHRLTDRHPGLRVAIVGKGPDGERLRSLAQELGLRDIARFPGAVYEETELAPWFLSAHAFVYPVNIGLSLLHAMGYGLPVVTSDNRTNHGPEIDAHRVGETGLEYREGDADDLARVVSGLLDDEALRTRLGEEARRSATTEWSVGAMVDGMERAIRAAAARARR